MRRRSFSRISFVLVPAFLCASQPLVAQAGRIWVEPRVGWITPTRDLGRTDVLGNVGFGIFERVEPSLLLGVAAGVGLSSRWALRASFDRALDATTQGEWRCVPFVACPAVLLPLEGELTRWTATIDGLYRPVTGLPLNPVIIGGIGFRRSELNWGPPGADITLPAFSFDENQAVFRLGAGLERSVGRVRLFGEFEVTTTQFGGGPYESVEGNVEADRTRSFDIGLVGGGRIRLW